MVNGIVASLLVVLAASSQTDQAVQTPAPAIVLPPASETQETGVKEAPAPLKVPETMSLAGPRVGFTFLSDGVIHKLRGDYGEGIEVGSFVSQFGWQKEKRFLTSENGGTAVTEWVILFGGLDQGVVLPSFSWLVGFRTARGVEFAVGPNLTPVGAAIAAAAGVTFRAGNLNVPVNLAVVPSKSGVRVSVLAGFNARRGRK